MVAYRITKVNAEMMFEQATALVADFNATQDIRELDTAVLMFERVVALQLPMSPYRIITLRSLAKSLSTRFTHTHQPDDLKRAIAIHCEAIKLLPAGHPDRPQTLCDLAIALIMQYEHSDDDNASLNDAIALYREVLTLAAPPIVHTTSTDNLAYALLKRFEISEEVPDLEEAIALYRRALKMYSPSDVEQLYNARNDLASALCTRFQTPNIGQQQEDLDEAIELHRQVLSQRPEPHPKRHDTISNLADAYLTRYIFQAKSSDLDEGIELLQAALPLMTMPSNQFERDELMTKLASALKTRERLREDKLEKEQSLKPPVAMRHWRESRLPKHSKNY